MNSNALQKVSQKNASEKKNQQFICKTGFGLCLGYSKLTTLTTSWNYQARLLDIVFLLPASQLWKGLFLLWNYALEIVIHEVFDVQFEERVFVLYICHDFEQNFSRPNQLEPSRKIKCPKPAYFNYHKYSSKKTKVDKQLQETCSALHAVDHLFCNHFSRKVKKKWL